MKVGELSAQHCRSCQKDEKHAAVGQGREEQQPTVKRVMAREQRYCH